MTSKSLLLICFSLFATRLVIPPVEAFSFNAGNVAGGSDIRGVVIDSSNGERILGANVVLEGTSRGSTTNNNGFYLISSVPPGNYSLVVSAVGFTRRTVMVRVEAGDPIVINIKLASRLIETNEVVVKSETISSLTERSASVHIVTPRDLQRLPSAGQQDLLRSLQMLPGITSTSDVSAKFYVRGGAGDQNLILLDGMKLYNPFHAFGLFSVLDPDIVRNAEVYTGAFPAGYGGRLSSVVNVTTKDGNLSKLSGNANVNFLSGKLELDGPLGDDNSWLVSGRSSLFGSSINKMIPNAAPTSFSDLFFKATVGTSTGRFGFRGYASGDDVTPTAQDQPNHSWRNSAYSAIFSSLITDRLYFDASVSYSRSFIERIAKSSIGVTPASSLLEETSLRGEMTSYLDNQNTFFEGFELTIPTIKDSLYTNNGFPRKYSDSELEWYAWMRYSGTAGHFRYDLGAHADLPLLFDGGEFLQGVQPRFTLSYLIGPTWIVKASYGIYTQKLITISNEDDLISLFDAWLILPKEIGTEEARHYVLGIEGNILPSLATNVQVYSKDYRSLTLYNTNKVFPADPDYIRGTGLAYGAEGLLRFTSSLIDLYASYALSKVTLTANDLTYTPRYDRRHTIKAIATVHVLENLEATIRWEYGSGYPFTQSAGTYDRLNLSGIGVDPFPEGGGEPVRSLGDKNAARLPAYHRMDAGFTYRFKVGMFKGTMGISVINIYDAKNILYYDRITGRTDYMTPFFPTASLSVEF